jgi:hypothetical protein
MFLKKNMKENKIFKIVAIFLFLTLNSCRGVDNMGFYQPITMDLKVPDGPPEFKAGWHAGCKSALANRGFQNSFVYQEDHGPDYGSGVYQHDPYFQTGWRTAFFACVSYVSGFVTMPSMQYSPLSK